MLKIEAGKTYKTRGGDKVRVICTDRRHEMLPIVALRDTDAAILSYSPEGKYFDVGTHPHDLVEEWREPLIMWVVIGSSGSILGMYTSREHADSLAAPLKRSRVIKLVEAKNTDKDFTNV